MEVLEPVPAMLAPEDKTLVYHRVTQSDTRSCLRTIYTKQTRFFQAFLGRVCENIFCILLLSMWDLKNVRAAVCCVSWTSEAAKTKSMLLPPWLRLKTDWWKSIEIENSCCYSLTRKGEIAEKKLAFTPNCLARTTVSLFIRWQETLHCFNLPLTRSPRQRLTFERRPASDSDGESAACCRSRPAPFVSQPLSRSRV